MLSWSQVVSPWKQEGTVKSPGLSVNAKEEEEERTSQSCKTLMLSALIFSFLCGIDHFLRL